MTGQLIFLLIQVLSLIGIDSGNILTKGEIFMQIHGVDVGFQIIEDNFPITEMGILGMPFLHSAQPELGIQVWVKQRPMLAD